jgi:hypothetical protein
MKTGFGAVLTTTEAVFERVPKVFVADPSLVIALTLNR